MFILVLSKICSTHQCPSYYFVHLSVAQFMKLERGFLPWILTVIGGVVLFFKTFINRHVSPF